MALTREQIDKALTEARLDRREDDLIEAFKLFWRYDLVKKEDMARLWKILENR